MKSRLLLPVIFALASIAAMFGQSPVDVDIERTYGRKLGTTPVAVRDYGRVMPVDPARRSLYKRNKPRIEQNFGNADGHPGLIPGLPGGADPLFQDMDARSQWDPNAPIAIAEGISRIEAEQVSAFPDIVVPDMNGDVNSKYFVQAVNATAIQVFDRLGNRIGEPFSANAIWEQIGFTSAGDPIILWDAEAGRWFLAEFPFGNTMLIAISDTDDPLGTWTTFSLNTPSFPDYPKFGLWPDAYLLTVNEFTAEVPVYVINREDLLNGVDTFRAQRLELDRINQPGVQSPAPVGWVGSEMPASDVKPMFMRINDDQWGNGNEDRIELFEVDVDWTGEANTQVIQQNIPLTPFDAEFCEDTFSIFVCLPQPNLQTISGIPRIIWHRVSYRNFNTHSSIVFNFGVDATGENDGGIRWVELRRSPGDDWKLFQEGTVGSQDGLNRFLGAINIDGQGNIGLAYAVASEDKLPSLRYTGRKVDDPAGIMTIDEREIATGRDNSNTPRYGDYQSMAVDEGNTFWFTGQYVVEGGRWATTVASFRIAREQRDVGILQLESPQTSLDLDLEDVTASIRNFGLDTISELIVEMTFDDTLSVSDTLSGLELLPDSILVHTFSKQVALTEIGDYTIALSSNIDGDLNGLNDSCTVTVRRLARIDVGPASWTPERMLFCESTARGTINIENYGIDTIRNVAIEVIRDAGDRDTTDFEVNIPGQSADEVEIAIEGFAEGSNEVIINTLLPNGMEDEYAPNDSVRIQIQVSFEGESSELVFTTDGDPGATTWELQDEDGNTLITSPDYTQGLATFVEDWCLDHQQCYRFIVYDADSNGLASSVNGDFEIINKEGLIVADLRSPFFGFSDTTDFCLDFECTLRVNPFVNNESQPGSSDGIINLFTAGGRPPYEYSIDSGRTFDVVPIFSMLGPGQYECMVRDASNCLVDTLITVFDCNIEAMYEVQDASSPDSDDGVITVDAQGGRGTTAFRINNGTFQNEPQFDGLVPATYFIEIRDSLNCRTSDSVEVRFTTSTEPIQQGALVKVYPNPSSDGIYFIEIDGLNDLFATAEVLDINGKIIMQQEMSSFNGVLKGAISIMAYPEGVYFLRLRHPQLQRLIPLLRAGG